MRIAEAISKHGRQAVRRYRDVAGVRQDNELPEIFLGGMIACGIHDDLNLSAHVERLYTTIAKELGRTIDPKLINLFGGQRADVAVYEDERPIAIIELKKFDDWKSPAGIVADRDKVKFLAQECGISSYLGVLVTDVEKPTLMTYSQRRSLLEASLGQSFEVPGESEWTSDKRWEWCFAAVKVT